MKSKLEWSAVALRDGVEVGIYAAAKVDSVSVTLKLPVDCPVGYFDSFGTVELYIASARVEITLSAALPVEIGMEGEPYTIGGGVEPAIDGPNDWLNMLLSRRPIGKAVKSGSEGVEGSVYNSALLMLLLTEGLAVILKLGVAGWYELAVVRSDPESESKPPVPPATAVCP